MKNTIYKNFKDISNDIANHLKKDGEIVHSERWQAIDADVDMIEIMDINFKYQIPDSIEELVEQINPDLPWADVHFLERICGYPLNPTPSYLIWPYYRDDNKWRRINNKFSHTYPERMWAPSSIYGIRFPYGNLNSIIDLLARDKYTRQAFLPIWFPEDTGAMHGERVPCTIGYWFILRHNKLNIYYPIRSCDYRRHFKNDVYLACRLLKWVLEKLGGKDLFWCNVKPGILNMHIWNMHIFKGEENFI